MAETKFSSEQIEQFIDIYRSFECLLEVKITYRDVNKRNNAYGTIADIMNITVEQVKKKINNLRSMYLQEKKRIEVSKTTGSGTDDIYVPSLSWFSSMSFIDDVTTPRKTTSTITTEKAVKRPANKEPNNNIATQESPRTSNIQFHSKKRVRQSENNADSSFHDAVNILTAICKDNSTEFDKFGESLAAQLKQMPLEDALQLQLQIQQLVTQYRLRLLRQGTSATRYLESTVSPGLTSPLSPEVYHFSAPFSVYSYQSTNSPSAFQTTEQDNDIYSAPHNPIGEAMRSANIANEYQ